MEEKKKQIDEKRMEAVMQQADSDRKLRAVKVLADIAVENQRKQLIEQKTDSERKEADAKGYVIEVTLKP